MKIEINPSYCTDGGYTRSCIAAIPKNFEKEGTVIFSGRNMIKKFKFRSADGCSSQNIIVKRYKRPNFFQKIAYSFFCKTKAQKAYSNGLELLKRGFATPESIAYIEVRRLGLIDYCYYICGEDYDHPITERMNTPEKFDTVMSAEFAHFVADLQKKGILHHDLNSTNVLFHLRTADENPSGGKYAFSLIDNNRMKFLPEDTLPPAAECMENITRFTGRKDLFCFVGEEYCRYLGCPDISMEKLLTQKRRHDRRRTIRKAILHLRFRDLLKLMD